ncbi:hypothetical protein ACXPVS_09030 [Pseudomonas sp. Ma2-10]
MPVSIVSVAVSIANRTERWLGLFDHYRDGLLKGSVRGGAYVNLDGDSVVVVAPQFAVRGRVD